MLTLLLSACSPRHVPQAPSTLPQPVALFEAHLAAIGGADAVEAHQTRLTTGTVYVDAQEIAAPFSVAQAMPAEVFTTTRFPGGLSLQSGVSDGVAWARDPGARYRYDDERTAAIRRGSLHRAVHDAEGAAAMTVLGRADFHGVDAWRVALDYADGPDEDAWFSVSDGRLVGRTEWGDSEAAPEEVLLEDWVVFDGVAIATRETRWMEGLVMRSEVAAVSVNQPVDTGIPADLAPPPGPDIVLPLRRRGSHVILPVWMGGEERMFLLDTGANATVIDADLAAELGMPAAGLVVPAGGAAGEIAGLRLQRAVPMRIGERDYPAVMVAVLDLEGLGLDGVLGADVLSWHTIDIDPVADELRLTDTAPDVRGLTAIPVQRFSAGLLQLTVTVAGTPVVAMLDLGADVTVLSWKAANLAGLTYGDGERDGALMGADGRAVPLFAAAVDLELGALELGEQRISIANLDALSRHFGVKPAALVGQDLLVGRRVVIDYAGGVLYLGG